MRLMLPNCPGHLPAGLAAKESCPVIWPHAASSMQGLLSTCGQIRTQPVEVILGSPETPALYWFSAALTFPEAQLLCHDAGPQSPGWRDLRTGKLVIHDDSGTDETDRNPQPAHKPAPQDATGALLHSIFLRAAWGVHNPQNQRFCDEKLEEARRLEPAHPGFYAKARQAYMEGQRAYQLSQEALKQFKQLGDGEAFEQWFEQHFAGEPKRVRKSATIQINKQREFLASKRKKHQQWQPCQVLAPRIEPGGHHPNSLPFLESTDHWRVMIDETGSRFEPDAAELSLNNQQLGRVVALAMPFVDPPLPKLTPGFHAVNADHAELDKIVNQLLNAPVGVLGLTIKDPLSGGPYSWFTAIYTLMRLSLRQLPVEAGAPVRVSFLIEERGGNREERLSNIAELLEAEARRIDPDRFANLRVDARFIGKEEDPYNGYVDTIAHCWGSPSREGEERLEKSQWLNHCLLLPDNENIARLLMAADSNTPLQPDHWLQLCGQLDGLPANHLVHDLLHRLGEHTRRDAVLWRSYVEEVQEQLRLKRRNLKLLEPALSWLEAHTPEQNQLPPALRLQLRCAQLATTNHRGRADTNLVNECLKLGKVLLEEDVPLVAESYLRIAVSATNVYEFDAAANILAELTRLPEPALGRLMLGKVASTQGQLAAFSGEPERAISLFRRALECFNKLSDPGQSIRERAQSGNFLLIASTDNPATCDARLKELIGKAVEREINHPGDKALKYLAQSDNDHVWRHYVTLRALCMRPTLAPEWRQTLLEARAEWQSGTQHPWPLIEFYRGWLLLDAGERTGAVGQFKEALALLRDESNGPTLHWMAEALAATATALLREQGVTEPALNSDLTAVERLCAAVPHLPRTQFEALAAASSAHAVRELLPAVLPFNFH